MATLPLQSGCLVIFLLAILNPTIGQDFEFQQSVSVTAESTDDWIYAITGTSSVRPPEGLSKGYVSQKQTYDLYGPDSPGGQSLHPLIIDVSPQDRPKGWYYWEPICRDRGMMYATPQGMGNGQPIEHRVRAVLDVLNDIRAKSEIDPQRTYLVGFSGGGQVACQVAFRLPEYFGGVICIGHSPMPPHEPWLRDRWREKMSIALIAGEREAASALNSHLAAPLFKADGIRTEALTIKRRGHVMPDSEMLGLALDWLEADLGHRQDMAKLFPAISLSSPPAREEWTRLLQIEAKARLDDPELLSSGLDQLEWIAGRWPDLPCAKESRELADSYHQRDERPWEAERVEDSLKLLQTEARGLEALAVSTPKVLRTNRRNLHRRAIAKWQEVLDSAPTTEIADATCEHLRALEKLTDTQPQIAEPLPLNSVRFRMVGTVTLSEGIEYFRQAVEPLGYTIDVDPSAQQVIQLDGDRKYELNLPTVTVSEIRSRFFRRAGLALQVDKSLIRLTSLKANR
jgi:predicted esterase